MLLGERVDQELQQGHLIVDHIKWLSVGPSQIAKKYTGYFINDYKFHTMKHDANCVTVNNGVTLTTQTTIFSNSRDKNPVVREASYYGSIEEIIEVLSWKFQFCVIKMCMVPCGGR